MQPATDLKLELPPSDRMDQFLGNVAKCTVEEFPGICRQMIDSEGFYKSGESLPKVVVSALQSKALEWWKARRDIDTSDPVEGYANIRDVLLMLNIAITPYDRASNMHITITCADRLLVRCADPQVVYLGLLLTYHERNGRHRLQSSMASPATHAIAYGWGSSPSLADILAAASPSAAAGLGIRPAGSPVGGKSGAAAPGGASLRLATPPTTPLSSGEPFPFNTFERPSSRLQQQQSLQQQDATMSQEEVVQKIAENLRASADDPVKMLWWARCRIVAMMTMSSGEASGLLRSHAGGFFRDLTALGSSINEILDTEDPTVAAAIVDCIAFWGMAGDSQMHVSVPFDRSANTPWHQAARHIQSSERYLRGSYKTHREWWQRRGLVDLLSHCVQVRGNLYDSLITQQVEILKAHPEVCPRHLVQNLTYAFTTSSRRFALQGEGNGNATRPALDAGLMNGLCLVLRSILVPFLAQSSTAREEGGAAEEGMSWYNKELGFKILEVIRAIVTTSQHHSVNPVVFFLAPQDGFDLAQGLHEVMRRRHPAPLAASSVALFTACIHNNVRDVVPALLERGVLTTMLELCRECPEYGQDAQCLPVYFTLPAALQAFALLNTTHELLAETLSSVVDRLMEILTTCAASQQDSTLPGQTTALISNFGHGLFGLVPTFPQVRRPIAEKTEELLTAANARLVDLGAALGVNAASDVSSTEEESDLRKKQAATFAAIHAILVFVGSAPLPQQHGSPRSRDPLTRISPEMKFLGEREVFGKQAAKALQHAIDNRKNVAPYLQILNSLTPADFAVVWEVIKKSANAMVDAAEQGHLDDINITFAGQLVDLTSNTPNLRHMEHVSLAKERLQNTLFDLYFALPQSFEAYTAAARTPTAADEAQQEAAESEETTTQGRSESFEQLTTLRNRISSMVSNLASERTPPAYMRRHEFEDEFLASELMYSSTRAQGQDLHKSMGAILQRASTLASHAQQNSAVSETALRQVRRRIDLVHKMVTGLVNMMTVSLDPAILHKILTSIGGTKDSAKNDDAVETVKVVLAICSLLHSKGRSMTRDRKRVFSFVDILRFVTCTWEPLLRAQKKEISAAMALDMLQVMAGLNRDLFPGAATTPEFPANAVSPPRLARRGLDGMSPPEPGSASRMLLGASPQTQGVDPARAETELVGMGYSPAQARNALRRNQNDYVLAMDYLERLSPLRLDELANEDIPAASTAVFEPLELIKLLVKIIVKSPSVDAESLRAARRSLARILHAHGSIGADGTCTMVGFALENFLSEPESFFPLLGACGVLLSQRDYIAVRYYLADSALWNPIVDVATSVVPPVARDLATETDDDDVPVVSDDKKLELKWSMIEEVVAFLSIFEMKDKREANRIRSCEFFGRGFCFNGNRCQSGHFERHSAVIRLDSRDNSIVNHVSETLTKMGFDGTMSRTRTVASRPRDGTSPEDGGAASGQQQTTIKISPTDVVPHQSFVNQESVAVVVKLILETLREILPLKEIRTEEGTAASSASTGDLVPMSIDLLKQLLLAHHPSSAKMLSQADLVLLLRVATLCPSQRPQAHGGTDKTTDNIATVFQLTLDEPATTMWTVYCGMKRIVQQFIAEDEKMVQDAKTKQQRDLTKVERIVFEPPTETLAKLKSKQSSKASNRTPNDPPMEPAMSNNNDSFVFETTPALAPKSGGASGGGANEDPEAAHNVFVDMTEFMRDTAQLWERFPVAFREVFNQCCTVAQHDSSGSGPPSASRISRSNPTGRTLFVWLAPSTPPTVPKKDYRMFVESVVTGLLDAVLKDDAKKRLKEMVGAILSKVSTVPAVASICAFNKTSSPSPLAAAGEVDAHASASIVKQALESFDAKWIGAFLGHVAARNPQRVVSEISTMLEDSLNCQPTTAAIATTECSAAKVSHPPKSQKLSQALCALDATLRLTSKRSRVVEEMRQTAFTDTILKCVRRKELLHKESVGALLHILMFVASHVTINDEEAHPGEAAMINDAHRQAIRSLGMHSNSSEDDDDDGDGNEPPHHIHAEDNDDDDDPMLGGGGGGGGGGDEADMVGGLPPPDIGVIDDDDDAEDDVDEEYDDEMEAADMQEFEGELMEDFYDDLREDDADDNGGEDNGDGDRMDGEFTIVGRPGDDPIAHPFHDIQNFRQLIASGGSDDTERILRTVFGSRLGNTFGGAAGGIAMGGHRGGGSGGNIDVWDSTMAIAASRGDDILSLNEPSATGATGAPAAQPGALSPVQTLPVPMLDHEDEREQRRREREPLLGAALGLGVDAPTPPPPLPPFEIHRDPTAPPPPPPDDSAAGDGAASRNQGQSTAGTAATSGAPATTAAAAGAVPVPRDSESTPTQQRSRTRVPGDDDSSSTSSASNHSYNDGDDMEEEDEFYVGADEESASSSSVSEEAGAAPPLDASEENAAAAEQQIMALFGGAPTSTTSAPASGATTTAAAATAPTSSAAAPAEPQSAQDQILALFGGAAPPPAPTAAPAVAAAGASGAGTPVPSPTEQQTSPPAQADDQPGAPLAPPAPAAADGPAAWEGVLDPAFLQELPSDVRREIVRENWPIICRPEASAVNGTETRIHPLFLEALSDELRAELLAIENEMAPVHPTGPSDTAVLLASVPPELREDILLTCDLAELQSEPALLEEAQNLRRVVEERQRASERRRQEAAEMERRVADERRQRFEALHNRQQQQIFRTTPDMQVFQERRIQRPKKNGAHSHPTPKSSEGLARPVFPDDILAHVAGLVWAGQTTETALFQVLHTATRSHHTATTVINALVAVAKEPLTAQSIEFARGVGSSLVKYGLEEGVKPPIAIVSRVFQLLTLLLERNYWYAAAFMRLFDSQLQEIEGHEKEVTSDEQSLLDQHPLVQLVDLVAENPVQDVQAAFDKIVKVMLRIRKHLVTDDAAIEAMAANGGAGSAPVPTEGELHPRHEHPLKWTDVRTIASYQGGPASCNTCDVRQCSMTFNCPRCNFDLCANCFFDKATLPQQVQRHQRWAYLIVEHSKVLLAAHKLLSAPTCAEDTAFQIMKILTPGICAAASDDAPSEESIDLIERWLIQAARDITAEIAAAFTRLEKMKEKYEDGAIPENLVCDALSAFDLKSLPRLYAFLLPYAEAKRAQHPEIRRMWHSSQLYLSEVTALLQLLPQKSSIPLPSCVMPLINGFAQFHLLAGIDNESTRTMERSETETLLSEVNHESSTISTNAVAEAAGKVAEASRDRDRRRGGAGGRSPFDHSGNGGAGDDQSPQSPTSAAAAATQRAVARERVPSSVVKFIERNRLAINTLIRWDPKLLDTSFSFAMRAPRFIDYEFKIRQFRRAIEPRRSRIPQLTLNLDRHKCFTECFFAFRRHIPDELRGAIHIKFKDEEGADAGGLTREFFQILGEEIINIDYGLFVHSSEGMTFQPNPLSDINAQHLEYFYFCGQVVAMAVFNNIPVDVHFTRSVYRHLIGIEPCFRDVESIDPELFKNMEKLLQIDLDEVDLGLDFTVTLEKFGEMIELELVPGGADIPVTNKNKKEYIRKRCANRMTGMIDKQLLQFLAGFYTIVPRHHIEIFTEQELELVISGLPDVDVEDLRSNTDYQGYSATSPQIRWFWETIASVTKEDRANLLQFTTGASKVPPGGFGNLEGLSGKQRFHIARVDCSTEQLPVAHTCFNRIDLPVYPTAEILREKLLIAITLGNKGFAIL